MDVTFFRQPQNLFLAFLLKSAHAELKEIELEREVDPTNTIAKLDTLTIKLLSYRTRLECTDNPNYLAAIYFLVAEVYWHAMKLGISQGNVEKIFFYARQILACMDQVGVIYKAQRETNHKEPDYTFIASFNSFSYAIPDDVSAALTKVLEDCKEVVAPRAP